ncbi:SSI family serine proteinase inhibitor [Streptomyces noursei]|uniref:SSI family serine proteinase inhibitor n=1 Tax=Streptomyces noursei TaxID=1971 RepID=UPI00268396E9
MGTALAGTAHATSTEDPPGGRNASSFTLSISSGAQHSGGDVRTVTLKCSPEPSGTHPQATAACAALDKVHGDFELLMPQAPVQACTLEWDPVTVKAEGTWKGRNLSFERTYGNYCVAKFSSAQVFSF